MPNMSSTPPPRPKPGGGPMARLFAAIAVVVMGVMIVYVVMYTRRAGGDGPRQIFDPATTNPDELRRVVEAVSRVIAAPPSQHELAVQTLETVRADSAGARDLKESCVNTYRGTIHAEEILHEIIGLIGGRRGGGRRADPASPSD